MAFLKFAGCVISNWGDIITVTELGMKSKRIQEITDQEIKDKFEAEIARIGEPLFIPEGYSSSDRHLYACLHLAGEEGEDWDTYAEGYRRAGDILVDYVADNDRDQDFLVYPIAFLYRHYLELRLKELRIISSKLSGRSVGPFPEHNLMKLWSEVRPNIDKNWLSPQIKGNLDTIEERLKELQAIDPLSDAFRYPENKMGEPSLKRMQEINLKHLQEVVQGISNILDGISYAIGMKLEKIAEYWSEMSQSG